MERLRLWFPLFAGMVVTGCSSERSHAEAAAPQPTDSVNVSPGSYVTQAGWGQLRIHPSPGSGELRFQLETENSGYGCSMAGTIGSDPQSILVDRIAEGDQCSLTMQVVDDGIEVGTASPDACALHCGNNGSFKGTYLSVDDLCGADSVTAAIKTARSSDSPHTAAPAESMDAVLRKCGQTLTYSTLADVRLAVAAARHRIGDNAHCLAALAPYAEDASRSDDDLTDGMSPSAADQTIAVMSSVREMLELCGK